MLITILLRQIAIMAILMIVGLYLSRRKYLTSHGTKELGAILLRLVIPCVIIKSYITDYSPKRLVQLGLSAGLALMGFIVSMLISYIVFGKRKRLENVAAAFCNAGFIGIPLTQAVIGEDGVFLVAASVALLNLFQWTYGVYIMANKKEAISFKAIASNPVVIAIIIGVVLYLLQLPVPDICVRSLEYIASMNTPVAMILMGSYLAKIEFRKIFDPRAFSCIMFRLVIIPVVILLLLRILPVHDTDVTMAVFLAAATPVGANICIFAQQYDCDEEFSVITVCLSTILSVATIPVLTMAANMLL